MIDDIKMTGELIVEIRDAKTGRLKSRDVVKNLVVTAGKASIAQALRGNVASNTGQITYCAVGTGTTAPAVGNTALVTELYRKLISIRSATGAIASFQTFYNTSEGNGALKEAGLFGDLATSSAGSGTLYARTLFTRTKTSSDTLTLTWNLTVN